MPNYIVMADGQNVTVTADRIEEVFDTTLNAFSFRFWQEGKVAAFFPAGRAAGYWFSPTFPQSQYTPREG